MAYVKKILALAYSFVLMAAALHTIPALAGRGVDQAQLASHGVSADVSEDDKFVYISGGDSRNGETCYGMAEGIVGRDKPSVVAEQAVHACYDNRCLNCRTPVTFGGVY